MGEHQAESKVTPFPRIQADTPLNAQKRAWLFAFAKTGRYRRSCRAIRTSTSRPYEWMQTDELFREEYLRAKAIAATRISDAIMRRAVDGWTEPVFHQGEVCGHVRRFDGPLLKLAAQAYLPEFKRENRAGDVNVTITQQTQTNNLYQLDPARQRELEEWRKIAELPSTATPAAPTNDGNGHPRGNGHVPPPTGQGPQS